MSEHPESPFFRTWAILVLRFKILFVLLTVGLTIFAIYNARTKLYFDPSTEYLTDSDTEVASALEEYRDDFGRDDLYMIVVQGDVFTMPFLEKLKRLHEELESLDPEIASQGQRRSHREVMGESDEVQAAVAEEKAADPLDDFGDFGEDEGWGDEAGGTLIEEVTSLLNARQTLFDSEGITVEGLLDEFPTADQLPALRNRVLADPVLVGTVVGREGRHAVISVRTDFVSQSDSAVIANQITALAETYEEPDFKILMSGMPIINATVTQKMLTDMPRLVAAAVFCMAIVLIYLFRHPVAVIASLIVVILSTVWTIGSMALLGSPVTLLTNIVPVFLMCVGMGDSVHIQSVFHDERRKGVPSQEAIVTAVASTGIPIVFTTLTTMAGLLSFNLASTRAIGEMGSYAAFGVFVALVHSVVILPILLSFIGPAKVEEQGQRKRDLIDSFLERLTRLSEHRPSLTVAGAVVCLMVAAGGMSLLDVNHNPLIWLGDDHPTTRGVLTMDEHVGGTASVHILLESDSEYGLKDLELLRRMEKLETYIADYVHPDTGQRQVTDTISVLDIIRETNRALHSGDQAHYGLPDNQRAVSDTMLLFENAGPDELRKIATGDLKKSHITVRLRWMDASSYAPFQVYLQKGIDDLIGDAAEVRVTGTAYELLSVVGQLITDMIRSFSGAAITVLLMMLLLLRSLKLGLISMAPNLLPIALILAFMGFVGFPIDMTNLLIGSIVIGIAVDDTIHYLHQFRRAQEVPGTTTNQAIQHALDHAGRALVSTSVILAMGFSVYTMSSMRNIQRFGILIALTCVGALVINIALAPALLRVVYPEPPDPERP